MFLLRYSYIRGTEYLIMVRGSVRKDRVAATLAEQLIGSGFA